MKKLEKLNGLFKPIHLVRGASSARNLVYLVSKPMPLINTL